MNSKLFTFNEVNIINYNLREIEKTLGHPIPGGIVDVSELKDRTLRTDEIHSLCYNLREVEKRQRMSRKTPTYSTQNNYDPIDAKLKLFCISLVGVFFLIKFLFF